MKIHEGLEHFFNYQRLNVKKNTFGNYEFVLGNFHHHFGDIELSSITSEDILEFMTKMYDGTKQSTKKLRFTLIAAFFNYIKNSVDPDFQNPCDNPALKKLFRVGKLIQFKILEKDVVDEIIFRTPNPRNRLMLELMARACMRVGEALKLKAKDIEDRKAIIRDPKSGKETEVAFLPQKVADRLKRYILENEIRPDTRIFPITYAAARIIVKKAGKLVGIHLKPHDLRRHAATYASRSGTPLEIVSKVILRHSNLSTTQRYLGKISDVEAMRWIDNLHG
jgi:integrase